MVALEQYIPIMLFIMVGAGFGSVLIALGFIAGKQKPDPAKLSPYECGFPEFESARLPFDVRFYLVAILFIIFDLETAFLFPWAVVFKDISWFGYASMMIFLAILTIGFIFEWKKGALQWE